MTLRVKHKPITHAAPLSVAASLGPPLHPGGVDRDDVTRQLLPSQCSKSARRNRVREVPCPRYVTRSLSPTAQASSGATAITSKSSESVPRFGVGAISHVVPSQCAA